MRIYLATKNAGKRDEFAALFAGSDVELVTYAAYRDPVEGEISYLDNAALKAYALRDQLVQAGIAANVLADDSGMEVRALGGAPGVISAYYGGADLTWAQRRRKVLDELAGRPLAERAARFVCALHFIAADDRELVTFATVEGLVANDDRGAGGFGYDPIFVYPPLGRTFAEMLATEKNRHSARAVALAALTGGLRAVTAG